MDFHLNHEFFRSMRKHPTHLLLIVYNVELRPLVASPAE